MKTAILVHYEREVDGERVDPKQRADPDAELVSDHVRERRLPETGRPVEEHVVEDVAALAGSGDLHAEVLAHRLLADVLVERLGPERRLDREVLVQALGHDDVRPRHQPPSPWRALAMMSAIMLGARAQATEPATNTAMATSIVIRRPWESLNLP